MITLSISIKWNSIKFVRCLNSWNSCCQSVRCIDVYMSNEWRSVCLLSYRPVARRRTRRSVLPNVSVSSAADEQLCTAGDDETRCCRRPLWISFREIGWDDWILAPNGYQAYYCYGACPPGHRTAHNHAAIRELVVASSAGGGLPIPRPACTATRLGPLALAHYLNGRRVVSIIDNMIVEECRCAWWNNDALPLINHGQTQSRLQTSRRITKATHEKASRLPGPNCTYTRHNFRLHTSVAGRFPRNPKCDETKRIQISAKRFSSTCQRRSEMASFSSHTLGILGQ